MCFCIFKVTLIVAWHCHDCTCTIVCQYEITDKYFYFSAIDWVDCLDSFQSASSLSFIQFCTIHIRFGKCLLNICLYFFLVLDTRHQILNKFSIWCKNHECDSIDCFNTSCKNREFTTANDIKFNFYTCRFTNPVTLHFLCGFWPVNIV